MGSNSFKIRSYMGDKMNDLETHLRDRAQRVKEAYASQGIIVPPFDLIVDPSLGKLLGPFGRAEEVPGILRRRRRELHDQHIDDLFKSPNCNLTPEEKEEISNPSNYHGEWQIPERNRKQFRTRLKHPFSIRYQVLINPHKLQANSDLTIAHELWHLVEFTSVPKRYFYPLIAEGTAEYAATRLTFPDDESKWLEIVCAAENVDKLDEFTKFRYLTCAEIVYHYMEEHKFYKGENPLKTLLSPTVRNTLHEFVVAESMPLFRKLLSRFGEKK